MNASGNVVGSKLPPRRSGTGRNRPTAFSWQPILNLPTRETVRARSVSRGWRSLLLDRQP